MNDTFELILLAAGTAAVAAIAGAFVLRALRSQSLGVQAAAVAGAAVAGVGVGAGGGARAVFLSGRARGGAGGGLVAAGARGRRRGGRPRRPCRAWLWCA